MQWIPLNSWPYDTLVALFLGALLIFAIIKYYFPFALNEFLQLLTNNKFIIIFNKEKNILPFSLLFSFIQVIFISIFLYVLLIKTDDFVLQKSLFLEGILLVGVLMALLMKLSLQLLISYIFGVELLMERYIFIRLSYSNYAAMLGMCSLLLALFGFGGTLLGVLFSFVVYVFVLLLGLLNFLRLSHHTMRSFWAYFLLYLCLFDVVPFLYLYKIIT